MFDRCISFGLLFYTGRRPRSYVYFTVRDILFCRRFKPIDSYKLTSPRGPETKHLWPRRTPINGVYAAGRLSFHSPFSQMYVRAVAERSLSGTPIHLLLVDAPNCAVPLNWMFHARLEILRAFVSSYPMDGILRISEKCSRPINGTTSAFTDEPWLYCRKHRNSQHHPCFRAIINLQPRIRYRFDLQETFFRRPSSRVLFFGRLQYRFFSNDSNTVWPSGDFCHNLQIFLCQFIFVTSLQSSTDIVCHGSVLFSVSA